MAPSGTSGTPRALLLVAALVGASGCIYEEGLAYEETDGENQVDKEGGRTWPDSSGTAIAVLEGGTIAVALSGLGASSEAARLEFLNPSGEALATQAFDSRYANFRTLCGMGPAGVVAYADAVAEGAANASPSLVLVDGDGEITWTLGLGVDGEDSHVEVGAMDCDGADRIAFVGQLQPSGTNVGLFVDASGAELNASDWPEAAETVAVAWVDENALATAQLDSGSNASTLQLLDGDGVSLWANADDLPGRVAWLDATSSKIFAGGHRMGHEEFYWVAQADLEGEVAWVTEAWPGAPLPQGMIATQGDGALVVQPDQGDVRFWRLCDDGLFGYGGIWQDTPSIAVKGLAIEPSGRVLVVGDEEPDKGWIGRFRVQGPVCF